VIAEAMSHPAGTRPRKKRNTVTRQRTSRKAVGMSVLLAEDNEVNSEVARAFLSELGCTVTCVQTGTAAVRAAAETRFDAILMDWEMPEMDGLTATQAIRAAELAAGRAPVPIIAMTSHAFDEDKRRCTQAGMTGYLSKPYRSEQLAAALEGARSPERGKRKGTAKSRPPDRPKAVKATSAAKTTPPPPAVAAALDEAAIEPMRNARPQLLLKLLRTYLETAPRILEELSNAVASADLQTAGRLAHGLKSSSATLGADRLSQACRALEQAAFTGQPTDCTPLLESLKARHADVRVEMESLGAELAHALAARTAVS
jgi:CheY-like chemotaxis protein